MMAAAKTPPVSPLDRVLFAFVTRGWNERRVAGYETELRARHKEMSVDVSHTFASIDSKATGLLTHASMMIAGLGLIAPLVADNRVEVGIIVLEMGVYLLIALGCLRCLSVFRNHDLSGAPELAHEIIHRELIIRSELYSFCIRSAIVFTIIVFLLLPVLFFWTPGK